MTALVEGLSRIVGAANVLTQSADTAAYLSDWRGAYHGAAQCVVRPASTAEVAAIVSLCAETATPIVPQGGNTSLCGASVPDASGRAIVLSLARMKQVRAIDLTNDTITVEAGCVLAELQRVADENDRLFPLSLASEGSCQIGGNLSTNAGGVQVLRYGNMRELVLGLEVVLPSGEVMNSLRGLRKDNTGYDLKQLFLGAEGTLGIITAAVLKLFPKPRTFATALVALPSLEAGVALLRELRGTCGDRLTAFEIMARVCMDLVLKHIPGTGDPFSTPHAWYALVELTDTHSSTDLQLFLEKGIDAVTEGSIVLDAVLAASESQRMALWALRENISEAQRIDGVSIKHDISVPVSSIAAFVYEADAALETAFPGIRIVNFGHIGDGNLHYNCSKPNAQDNREFLAQQARVNDLVYGFVAKHKGSISAEHGIGQLKRDILPGYKSAVEIALMKQIKQALDPLGIMNPGKVVG